MSLPEIPPPPPRTCNVCLQTKADSDFYAGVKSRCKECHKAAVRDNYQASDGRPEYERAREKRPERKAQKLDAMRKHRANNPLKYKARTAVSNALRDKRLFRQPCEVCGNERVQAHHDDYSKPLEVKWLCFEHHREDEHEQTIRSDPALAPAGTVV